jgi:hypothetical protein
MNRHCLHPKRSNLPHFETRQHTGWSAAEQVTYTHGGSYRKNASPDKRGPQFHSATVVHLKQPHRRPAGRRQADSVRVADEEMIAPDLHSRVEKSCLLTRLWVQTDEVRSFVEIAPTACPAKIREFIAAAMLPGYDVFQMERPLVDFSRQETVLAAVARTLSDELARR